MRRASASGAGNTNWSALINSSTIIAGRECLLSEAESPELILIQPLGNHERKDFHDEVERIWASSCVPFAMAGFQVLDWDLDLSPWLSICENS